MEECPLNLKRLPRPILVTMADLWRACERHGVPHLARWEEGYYCRISRPLGASTIKTSMKTMPTPEEALLSALDEAKLWGLPEIEPLKAKGADNG